MVNEIILFQKIESSGGVRGACAVLSPWERLPTTNRSPIKMPAQFFISDQTANDFGQYSKTLGFLFESLFSFSARSP
jgi:hypothetical protein